MNRVQMSRMYDVIVAGAGHAGTEAALAAARMGCRTLLYTINVDTLGHISCNPAVGGVGKGHITKEIDALGGEMGKAADFSGIQFRRLNSSKGPSSRGLRVQVDRALYASYIKRTILNQPNLDVKQGVAAEVLVEDGFARGIRDVTGQEFESHTVILTPGTFLNGLIHIGLKNFPGGRMGEGAASHLSENLRELGFKMGRFKTGTPPRLDGRTIDFSVMAEQKGDEPPTPFSFSPGASVIQPQVSCYITYTNERTHEIIRSGRDLSPLFTGVITGTGVRYCPSIEDKVTKFAGRSEHHVFLEPEGLDTVEYYPNGLSTSLPVELQLKMLRSIKGLEEVEIIRPGYGIEHDYSDPRQLYPTLETRIVRNLYFAGQINATTGYEEAAGQGIMAGINAALKVQKRQPLILDRSQAYIGVMIDDLVTKGTDEPYRIFSSRCEYRIILREDNADLRMRPVGFDLGLVSEDDYKYTQEKKSQIEAEKARLSAVKIYPSAEVNRKLGEWDENSIKKTTTLEELLRRPNVDYKKISELEGCEAPLPDDVLYQVELDIKYDGFIKRQQSDIEKFKNLENIKLPEDISYRDIRGLSNEVTEKLENLKPVSLGQASRIGGITPAAIWTLMMYLKKN